MKNLIIIFCLGLFFSSCEDIVDVKLENEAPRVVIEVTGIQQASNNEVIVKGHISKTSSYYSNKINYFENAEMLIELNNQTYSLQNNEDNILQYIGTLPAVYNEDYTLTVTFEGEQYQATTQLYKTVPFNRVEQSSNAFDENYTAINAYFTDPSKEENYYYFEFFSERHGRIADNTDDELFNGNEISTYYADEFEPNDNISITIEGISKRFNNYINLVLSQTRQSNNPFATNPVSIRGNVINPENPSKFAFGYFRMSQRFDTIYRVK